MKTVLITGASSGIGYELTRLFAEDQYHLVLVARNKENLTRLAGELKQKYGTPATIIPKDLSLPLSPAEIFIELQQKSIFVDVLVNNAGFATYGRFAETNITDELEMIQVNVTSLVHLTKLFVKEMLRKGEGKILNVASTAAFQPGPLMAVYYATKAFVLSFSEALSEELRGTAVTVTCLCPGATQTDFQKRAGLGDVRLFRAGTLSARAVAEAGYRGLVKNQRIVIPSFASQLFAFLVRLGPRSWVTRIVKFLQEKLKGGEEKI